MMSIISANSYPPVIRKTLDKIIEKAKVTEVDAPAEEKAEEGKGKKKSGGKKKSKSE